ncbi:GIY-YIG nuclease family protein, partial [Arthrobacter deserti]|nr:GIY-YIG nuclease family protein [Arthrobacter deserti]
MIHRNNPTERRTYLYRIYDRHGALLYVGTAAGPDLRFGAHGNRHRRWWPEAAAADWEQFPDPDEAAYAE